jgi:DNA polymerase I-like protein with 3'-5' exonuclease and polymerase domains
VERFAYLGPQQDSEEELLDRLFLDHHDTLAVDTETISLKDRTCIGIGVSPNTEESYYFPVLPDPSPYLSRVHRLLGDPDTLKVFHNSTYDLDVLGEPLWPFADTLLMLSVQALPLKLAEASQFYAGRSIQEISDILPARKTMLDIPTEVVAEKCLHDALSTHRLYEQMGGSKWKDKANGHTWTYTPNWFGGWNPLEPMSYYVSPQMKDCYDVDIRLIPMLMEMGSRGLALRQDKVQEWYTKLSQEILFYQDICTQEGFSPGSNQQVGYTLAARGTVLDFTQTKGRNAYKQLKVDENVLSQLDDPLARVVLEFRKRDKLLGTYLRPWLGEDRAFAKFALDTGTGRLNSFNRNLQNVPKRIREIFAPDSGLWTWADYNQIEMRIFAYQSQDPKMLEAYRLNSDIHTTTQLMLYPGSSLVDNTIRTLAKGFNFSMIFWAQPYTMSVNSGLPIETCARYREQWLDYYDVAAAYMLRQIEMGMAQGWTMTDFGRKQRLPDPTMFPDAHIASCSINYPDQGTAADVIKRAMLKCEGMDIAVQVHDELLADGDVDFPEGLDHIHPGVETPYKVRTGEVWK